VKLSVHSYLGRSRWLRRYIAAGATWVKVTDAPDVALAIAREFPKVNVIYRRIDTRQLGDWIGAFPDPMKAGEAMAALFGDIAPAPNLWVEGINEPVLNSVAEAEYLGKAEARRAAILAARGLKSIIGNFATGNPQNLMFVVWLRTYLGNGGSKASPIGVHQYGVLDLDPNADGFNLLGHQRLQREAGALASGMVFVATELGLDRIFVNGAWRGGGWRTQGNEQQYLAWLLKVEVAFDADRSIIAGLLFDYYSTDMWKDYDMEDANAVNDGLIAAVVADGQQDARPDCARTDVPDDWTHTVEATKGLNVRSSAANLGDANLLCAMVNGKQVRALKRVGDWMQIDWPVAGYCWAPNLKPRAAVQPPEHKLGTPITLPAGARFVDVSAWQDPADVDWKAMRWNGCTAAMIRLAAGTLTDPEWHLYAAGAKAAGIPWFGYVYFSFTVSWQSQIAALTAAINKMAALPTVALDLEGANPSKSDVDLRNYLSALNLMGVPVALYTRQSWVTEHLPQLATILNSVPLIVANYRYPVDAQPALPPGYSKANAWQHVAGERVALDKLYWARFMTRSGKYLDESIVMDSGLTVHAGA